MLSRSCGGGHHVTLRHHSMLETVTELQVPRRNYGSSGARGRSRLMLGTNLFDMRAEALNCRWPVQYAEFSAIGAALAGLQHNHLAGSLNGLAAKPVCAGLDADRILALCHHPPFDVAGHCCLVVGDRNARTVAEPWIDDGDM